MTRTIKIDYCYQCTFFHEMERRHNILKGYCENPDNKNIENIRKISINTNYEGVEDRIFPFINSKNIPDWCKLPNYELITKQ
jgi:hypothetical protein